MCCAHVIDINVARSRSYGPKYPSRFISSCAQRTLHFGKALVDDTISVTVNRLTKQDQSFFGVLGVFVSAIIILEEVSGSGAT